MDEASRKLARHALGLPNDQRKSYRNRYFANSEGRVFDIWCGLVEQGLAVGPEMATGISLARFELTDVGAKLSLEPGETLCREDFPNATRRVSA